MLNQIILGYCFLLMFSMGFHKFCAWYSDGGIINPFSKKDMDLLLTDEQRMWSDEMLRMFYTIWFFVVPLVTVWKLPMFIRDLYHTYRAKKFIKEFKKRMAALDEMERRFLEKFSARVKEVESQLREVEQEIKKNNEASK